MKREIIVNNQGTFVKLDPANFYTGRIPARVKELFAQPFKISAKRIKLNAHGGYLPDNIAKHLLTDANNRIDPSAIVADGAKVIGEGIFVGAGAIIGAGADLDEFVTVEDNAYIGPKTRLHKCTEIASRTFVGAENDITGNSAGGGAFAENVIIGDKNTIEYGTYFGENVVVGDGNYFRGDVTVESRTNIKDDNGFGARSYLGSDLAIGSHCEFGKLCEVGNKTSIADNTQIGDFTTVGENCKFASMSIDVAGRVGAGVSIGAQATLMSNVTVRDRAKIKSGAYIEDSVLIGKGAEVGAQARLNHRVYLGDKVKVPARKEIESHKALSAARENS